MRTPVLKGSFSAQRLCIYLFLFTSAVFYFLLIRSSSTAVYDFHLQREAERSSDVSQIRSNRYVKFNQLRGAGFNNQAQEVLLYHHLALESGRIYVYQPLLWQPRQLEKLPLSAFLRGATEGSINEDFFNRVCPPGDIVHISLNTTWQSQWDHAKKALQGNERCIVVDDWVLNWNFLASPALPKIWPSFKKYLEKHFKWSPSVNLITERALRKLGLSFRASDEPYMALHLRRGDFKSHCPHLADLKMGFTTWSSLPVLEPHIYPPRLNSSDRASVTEHCYPSIERILSAVTLQARRNPHIHKIHILHDGAIDHPFVYLQYYKIAAKLKDARWTIQEGWTGGPMKTVTQSADVPFERGEKDWQVCVDVELARRAAVFIGNGYSSLTSQILALRLGADQGKVENILLY